MNQFIGKWFFSQNLSIYLFLFLFQKLPKRKNFQRVESAASDNLDYTQYDTDNDQNLIFYNDNPQQQGGYTFS